MFGKAQDVLAIVLGGAAVVALVWIYKRAPSVAQIGAAAAAFGDAINPLNQDNVAYTAANSAVQSVTGQPEQTLGGWVYDLFHAAPDFNAPVTTAAPAYSWEDEMFGAPYTAPADLSWLVEFETASNGLYLTQQTGGVVRRPIT